MLQFCHLLQSYQTEKKTSVYLTQQIRLYIHADRIIVTLHKIVKGHGSITNYPIR
uniref:Uncharacterized protein n=1 Tax=Arundo donax TaxID=35708 RepID=A0A0A9DS07_ARUDO